MHVYGYVCMYVRTYVSMFKYKYKYIYICMYIYMHMYAHTPKVFREDPRRASWPRKYPQKVPLEGPSAQAV